MTQVQAPVLPVAPPGAPVSRRKSNVSTVGKRDTSDQLAPSKMQRKVTRRAVLFPMASSRRVPPLVRLALKFSAPADA